MCTIQKHFWKANFCEIKTTNFLKVGAGALSLGRMVTGPRGPTVLPWGCVQDRSRGRVADSSEVTCTAAASFLLVTLAETIATFTCETGAACGAQAHLAATTFSLPVSFTRAANEKRKNKKPCRRHTGVHELQPK